MTAIGVVFPTWEQVKECEGIDDLTVRFLGTKVIVADSDEMIDHMIRTCPIV